MRRFFQGFSVLPKSATPRKRPKAGGEAIERMLRSPQFEARKGSFKIKQPPGGRELEAGGKKNVGTGLWTRPQRTDLKVSPYIPKNVEVKM